MIKIIIKNKFKDYMFIGCNNNKNYKNIDEFKIYKNKKCNNFEDMFKYHKSLSDIKFF